MVGKKSGGWNKQRIGSIAHKTFKDRIDLAAGAGVVDLDLQSQGASSRFHFSQCRVVRCRHGWIDEHNNPSDSRHQLAQELQALSR
jgi:hypothetical protein